MSIFRNKWLIVNFVSPKEWFSAQNALNAFGGRALPESAGEALIAFPDPLAGFSDWGFQEGEGREGEIKDRRAVRGRWSGIHFASRSPLLQESILVSLVTAVLCKLTVVFLDLGLCVLLDKLDCWSSVRSLIRIRI